MKLKQLTKSKSKIVKKEDNNKFESTLINLVGNKGTFYITIIIVLAQILHYSAFFYVISGYEGIFRYIYSFFFSLVFGTPLLYFSLRFSLANILLDSIKITSKRNEYQKTIKFYTVVDIFINLAYWMSILLLNEGNISNLKDFNVQGGIIYIRIAVAVLISFLLPITLMKISGEINIKTI